MLLFDFILLGIIVLLEIGVNVALSYLLHGYYTAWS
jgi:hypothetical protein